MNYTEIVSEIKRKGSFLCIGLDSDIKKIPECLRDFKDPVFEFNRRIIDATADMTIAYKPNVAFYECNGTSGWKSLAKTANYIKSNYPEIFLIADAKRGDIGNTAKMYAEAFFKRMPFDAITVAPYMGKDSVTPFLEYDGKFVILLALTSNEGAYDFQLTKDVEGNELYKRIIRESSKWASKDKLMYVVGATKGELIGEVRKESPENFFLVPGVGAQGGSLEEVAKYGLTSDCGLIVNSSRGIIFADSSDRFDLVAQEIALKIRNEMKIMV